MKKFTLFTAAALMLSIGAQAQSWDFTQIDSNSDVYAELYDATAGAVKDATNWKANNGSASFTYITATENAPLMVGDAELSVTKGLTFKASANNITIYRMGSTSNYGKALELKGKRQLLTIPNLKAGDKVTLTLVAKCTIFLTNSKMVAEGTSEGVTQDETAATGSGAEKGSYKITPHTDYASNGTDADVIVNTVTADGSVSLLNAASKNQYIYVRKIEVTSGGESTGISEKVTVNSEKFAAAPAYNLAGQQVKEGYKGLVIKNGIKVVIK